MLVFVSCRLAHSQSQDVSAVHLAIYFIARQRFFFQTSTTSIIYPFILSSLVVDLDVCGNLKQTPLRAKHSVLDGPSEMRYTSITVTVILVSIDECDATLTSKVSHRWNEERLTCKQRIERVMSRRAMLTPEASVDPGTGAHSCFPCNGRTDGRTRSGYEFLAYRYG